MHIPFHRLRRRGDSPRPSGRADASKNEYGNITDSSDFSNRVVFEGLGTHLKSHGRPVNTEEPKYTAAIGRHVDEAEKAGP